MRLGVIARVDRGGLAAQTQEVVRHMDPAAILLVDLGAAGRGPANVAAFDGHPRVVTVSGVEDAISDQAIASFLEGLDVVWTAETFYARRLVDACAAAGIPSVCHANPELWNPARDHAAVALVATSWEMQRVDGARLLPHPVAGDRITAVHRRRVRSWFHQAAPAMMDRNGTDLLASAIPMIRRPCTIYARGEHNLRSTDVVEVVGVPGSVHYWDIPDAGALVLPRRYGGLSLPMQECMAAGMPLVSLDLAPQREWMLPELAVPATVMRRANMRGGTFPVHGCAPADLAATMTRLMDDDALASQASIASLAWRERHTWSVMRPAWRETLASAGREALR